MGRGGRGSTSRAASTALLELPITTQRAAGLPGSEGREVAVSAKHLPGTPRVRRLCGADKSPMSSSVLQPPRTYPLCAVKVALGVGPAAVHVLAGDHLQMRAMPPQHGADAEREGQQS